MMVQEMTPMAFDGGHVQTQDIARLVEHHQQALRAFLRRACGDWALADDLAQLSAQLEQEIKEKIAEVQATSDKKYQPKAAPKADTEPEPAEESTARQTRAAARAKLDIAVEDDDE